MTWQHSHDRNSGHPECSKWDAQIWGGRAWDVAAYSLGHEHSTTNLVAPSCRERAPASALEGFRVGLKAWSLGNLCLICSPSRTDFWVTTSSRDDWRHGGRPPVMCVHSPSEGSMSFRQCSVMLARLGLKQEISRGLGLGTPFTRSFC